MIGDFTSLNWVVNQNLECAFIEKAKYYQKMIKGDQNCVLSGLEEFRKKIVRSTQENPLSFPVVFTNSINVDDLDDGSNIDFGFGISITPGVCLDNMSCEQGDTLRLQWDFDSSVLPEEITREMFEDYQFILEYLFNNINEWESIHIHNIDNSYASSNKSNANNQMLLHEMKGLTNDKIECLHTLFEQRF
ncbi:hypothetical protein AAHB54_13985 [Bacillus cereus]